MACGGLSRSGRVHPEHRLCEGGLSQVLHSALYIQIWPRHPSTGTRVLQHPTRYTRPVLHHGCEEARRDQEAGSKASPARARPSELWPIRVAAEDSRELGAGEENRARDHHHALQAKTWRVGSESLIILEFFGLENQLFLCIQWRDLKIEQWIGRAPFLNSNSGYDSWWWVNFNLIKELSAIHSIFTYSGR